MLNKFNIVFDLDNNACFLGIISTLIFINHKEPQVFMQVYFNIVYRGRRKTPGTSREQVIVGLDEKIKPA